MKTVVMFWVIITSLFFVRHIKQLPTYICWQYFFFARRHALHCMYALFKIYIGKKNCFEAVRVNNCTVNIGASYYDLWLVHRVIIIFCFELCMGLLYIYIASCKSILLVSGRSVIVQVIAIYNAYITFF